MDFHYMPPNRMGSVFLQKLSDSAGPQVAIGQVSNLQIVPTPSIVSYYNRQLQIEFQKQLLWLTWQAVFV